MARKKNRYGTNQSVDNGTYNRTLNRIDALDRIPPDLEKNSKITGSDARRVKRLLRQQRGGATASNAQTTASKAQTKRPTTYRYGRKALTDSGVRDRTISRYNRLKAKGINPGVSQAQLDTGFGARKVKRRLSNSRKPTYSI